MITVRVMGSDMSLHLQNMGRVVWDLKGTELLPEECDRLVHPQTGGIILFSRNYESPEQVQSLIQSIRALRENLIIAVDQEGGRVQRFKEGLTLLPAVGLLGDYFRSEPEKATKLAEQCGWLMASELSALGVDLSFAPVLDVNLGLSEVIGNRSFGVNTEEVVALAGAFIMGMHLAGMASTGKHFPGHGGVSLDSHVSLPIDSRSWEVIENGDLKPFQLLVNQLDAVMPAHVVYNQCDDSPAGFSPFWLKHVLREKLNFRGVIFSDDLSMEGAAGVGGYASRAQAALEAGCDLVLVCNNPEGAGEVLAGLERETLLQPHYCVQLKLKTTRPKWQSFEQSNARLSVREAIQQFMAEYTA